MARKSKATIEQWVRTAIREQLESEGDRAVPEGIETVYEYNAGDFDIVRARIPDRTLDGDARYAHPVGDRTIRFSVLETVDSDEYRLRVRIE